jgi:hypothetical protein
MDGPLLQTKRDQVTGRHTQANYQSSASVFTLCTPPLLIQFHILTHSWDTNGNARSDGESSAR